MKTTVLTLEIVYKDMGSLVQGPDTDDYTGYYYSLDGGWTLLGSPCLTAEIALSEAAKTLLNEGWDK